MTPKALLQRLHRGQRGQAAFEFLLMIPLLVVFLLFVVDMGIAMYEYVSISNAVREGARYAAVNCDTGTCTVASVQGRAAGRAGGLAIPTSDVTATWSGPDRGDSVAVSISHPYNFLFFPGVTINVRACSEMRLEQQDNTTSLSGGGSC